MIAFKVLKIQGKLNIKKFKRSFRYHYDSAITKSDQAKPGTSWSRKARRCAIVSIQSLSAQEQRQLLQILSATVSKYDNLEQQDYLFWQKTSLEDLIET